AARPGALAAAPTPAQATRVLRQLRLRSARHARPLSRVRRQRQRRRSRGVRGSPMPRRHRIALFVATLLACASLLLALALGAAWARSRGTRDLVERRERATSATAFG